MTKRFEGKTCLVTGSAQGIGLATARRLAREGAVVIGMDIHEPSEEVAGVKGLVGDVTDLAFWQEATAAAGAVDVLVNNAGMVGSYESIIDITLDDWDRVVRLNQTGVFYGLRTVLPGMVERRAGAIVNVSSMWGLVGAAGVSAYQASKGAVTMMTKNAAATYAPDGVRVNSVHPGFIWTPMTDKQDAGISQGLIDQTPMARAGQADEVAAAIAFLASDDASFITGHQLVVDGGYTVV
jgi:NAD(P)-dependent dehydrogenase (short-subunit alcohol dehydrogenase family)